MIIHISYGFLMAAITLAWITVRACCSVRLDRVDFKREFQLIFVYICIVVVARFTFFLIFKVNGEIQPLVFRQLNTHRKVIVAGYGIYLLVKGIIGLCKGLLKK